MRFCLIFIVTFFYALLLSNCKNRSNVPDPSEEAKIEFSVTTNDYGDIAYGSDGKCRFEFINTSRIPVLIHRVRTSCGCANPEWPNAPIAPGDKSSISVEYNTRIPGTFQKTITVYSNAKNSPVTLYIKGNVIKETQP